VTRARARRLLVVEDDPEIRYLLSVVLGGEQQEVVTASSREEALRVLGAEEVALVVLDLILSDIDGRSLLSRIREDPKTAATPVVVLTGRVGPDTRQDVKMPWSARRRRKTWGKMPRRGFTTADRGAVT
jgi:CheY-like chemotaxis protein